MPRANRLYRLKVYVAEAEIERKAATSVDPILYLYLGDQSLHTTGKSETCTPVWNETLEFYSMPPPSSRPNPPPLSRFLFLTPPPPPQPHGWATIPPTHRVPSLGGRWFRHFTVRLATGGWVDFRSCGCSC